MESVRLLGMGPGVVAIMAAWGLVTALLLLIYRLPRSPFLKVAPVLLSAAFFFSFILVILPRKAKNEPEDDITKYDDTMVRRLGLLVVMAVTLLLGLKLLLVIHLHCPHYAQRLNRRHVDYYRRA